MTQAEFKRQSEGYNEHGQNFPARKDPNPRTRRTRRNHANYPRPQRNRAQPKKHAANAANAESQTPDLQPAKHGYEDMFRVYTGYLASRDSTTASPPL